MSTPEVDRKLTPDLKSFAPSIVRTVVPLAVTVVAGWPVTDQLGIEDREITLAVGAVVGGAYWLAVRVLERFVAPRFGWLLGYASAPVYAAATEVGATRSPVADVKRVTRNQDLGR